MDDVQRRNHIEVNLRVQQIEFPADDVNKFVHPFGMIVSGPTMRQEIQSKKRI